MLRAASAANASIAYNGYYIVANTATTDTTLTFTGVNFGTAASGRIVAVYMAGGTSATLDVNSVSIGGISATKAVSTGAALRYNAIFYAVVASGTSGNVIITYTNQLGNIADRFLGCASIYDANSTSPITGFSLDTGTNVAPSRSVTLTPSANSVLFAGYSAGGIAAGTTSSWTNATEQTDTLTGNSIYTDATDSALPETSRTITATGTDTLVNRPGLVVATWA